jgi:hypothetical protein
MVNLMPEEPPGLFGARTQLHFFSEILFSFIQPLRRSQENRDRNHQQQCHGEKKYRQSRPVTKNLMWIKKVHTKKTSDEGDRHEKSSDDGQCFHDFVHAIIKHREICVHRVANQVSNIFCN